MRLIHRPGGSARPRPDLFRWTLIGVCACILGLFAYSEIIIDLCPVRTMAQITAVTHGRSAGDADVTFTVQGRSVDTYVLLKPWAENPSTGDEILIEYAKWDPVEARMAGAHDPLTLLTPFLFLGLVLLVVWILGDRQAPRFVGHLWHRRFPPR